MVNVANTQINVDGFTMTGWSSNFTHNYSEYTLVAEYSSGKWVYGLAAVGSDEPIATLVVNGTQRQRTALTGLLLNIGVDYGTAADLAGVVYDKIKSRLEQLNPL